MEEIAEDNLMSLEAQERTMVRVMAAIKGRLDQGTRGQVLNLGCTFESRLFRLG